MTLEQIGKSTTGSEDIWICSDCLKKERPLGHALGTLKDGHCAGCDVLCVVMLYSPKSPVRQAPDWRMEHKQRSGGFATMFAPDDKDWDGGAE